LAPQTPNSGSPSVLDMLNGVASGDPMAGLAASQQPPTPLLPAPPTSSVPAPLAAAAQMPADSRQLSPATDTNRAAGPTVSDNVNPEDNDLSNPAGGFMGMLHRAATPSGAAGILGGIGTALALAKGSPSQKNIAVEQEQIPLKMQQLQNEALWRRGMLGVNQQNANTKGEVAATGEKTEQDKFAAGDNAMGLPEGTMRMQAETARQNEVSNQQLRQEHIKQMEATMNGEVMVPPGMGHAVGRDDLEGKSLPALEFTQKVANPYKVLGVKTQDLGADGVWGVSPLTGRITRLGDSPSVARANSMLLRTQLPVNDAQGNVQGTWNPQSQTFTPIGQARSAPAPGGGAVPSIQEAMGGQSMPVKPTSSMLTMGQMAQTIQAQVPQIKNEIDAISDKIGPAAGRWNNFWVKKAGADDPAYASLDMGLQLYATALGKAHFGASMPEGFVNDMMRDFGLAQSPADLKARIDAAQRYVNEYATHSGKGEAPKNAATPAATPKQNTAATFKEGDTATGPNNHKILYTGGRWVDAATKQPI
jgi:hypothetical protein